MANLLLTTWKIPGCEITFGIVRTDSGQLVVYVPEKIWGNLREWIQLEIIKKDIELAREFSLDHTQMVEKLPFGRDLSGKGPDSKF